MFLKKLEGTDLKIPSSFFFAVKTHVIVDVGWNFELKSYNCDNIKLKQ